MPSRAALLVVDLEGVAGVDSVEALILGTQSHPQACERLTREVNAAVEGLSAAGFDEVWVSDSHRPAGLSPNVLREALHPAARLFLEEDAYAEALYLGVEAVAALGMHVGAGTSGFAAHTVNVVASWSLAGRLLSELDLVLGLAAEVGRPAVFASGDQALDMPARGVRFVGTKRSQGPTQARSRAEREVLRELLEAAASAPRPSPPLPEGPLLLTFKSAWQAEWATRAGGERQGTHEVLVTGRSLRERYQRALALTAGVEAALGEVVTAEPGTAAFTSQAASLLVRPLPQPGPAPGAAYGARAAQALQAFLSQTSGGADWQRALRALTLHMLEGHAPRFFGGARLAEQLAGAVRELESFSLELPLDLDPWEAMARLDAGYVRAERGEAVRGPGCAAYLAHLAESGLHLHAWLFSHLGARMGMSLPLPDPSPLGGEEEPYWLAHRLLLESRYLRQRLDSSTGPLVERLLLAVPPLLEGRSVDCAAEVAFCLQAAGEWRSSELAALLGLLAEHQRPTGEVIDPGARAQTEDAADLLALDAHSTAAALIAFAGMEG